MTLAHLRDWFKSEFQWNESISIGKIDRDCFIAFCLYPAQTGKSKQHTVGGKKNRSYKTRCVTLLLRAGRNAAKADELACRVYDFFDEKRYAIDGENAFILQVYSEPISLGTDDSGIYEYSYEIEVYFNLGG